MKRIEMVGPSGVGKSTLYNNMSLTSMHSRCYLTRKDAYKLAAVGKNISVRNLKIWIYRQLLKHNLFDSRALGLGKTILHSLKKEGDCSDLEHDSIKISVNIFLEDLKKEKNPNHVYRRIKILTERIDEYRTFLDALPEDTSILFDEGLLHWHPGITDYAVNVYSAKDLQKDLILNPTGIISCEQSTDSIFDHLLKRKNRNALSFIHNGKTEEELRSDCVASVSRWQKRISRYEENNIPVLHIDTLENAKLNMKKINDFICSLESSLKSNSGKKAVSNA